MGPEKKGDGQNRKPVKSGGDSEKNPVVITDHKIRMSEIVLGFINPMVNDFIRSEEKLYGFFIDVAIIAWNASFLPEEKIAELVNNQISIKNEDEKLKLEELIGILISRKRKLYNGIDNVIINYDFKKKGDEYILNVMSAPVQASDGA